MSSKTYRVAAIGRTGKGNFGHNLHLAFLGLENVEYVAVADPDPAGREKAQRETQAPAAYENFRAMLEKERPDIVAVCPRWTDCHLEMVLACLEQGCHVYCEKPMTWDLEEADEIVATADRTGRKVAVAHQGVYLPRVDRIKEIIQSGAIGKIVSMHAYGKQDHRGGGEDLIVLGTHLFNLMRFFAGDPLWVCGLVRQDGRDIRPEDVHEGTEPVGPVAGDEIRALYAFSDGAAGDFVSIRNRPGNESHFGMEIAGTEGRIRFNDGTALDPMIYPYPLFAPWLSEQKWRPIDAPEGDIPEGNQLAILDLIEAIENDREPRSSARDARAALEMIVGVYESQLTGGRVAFPMENRKHPLIRFQETQ